MSIATRVGATRDIDLRVVTEDQALTSTEQGRALVEWLAAHAVDGEEWRGYVATVPAQQLDAVARAARDCARAWTEFAEALERRPSGR
jgi:hypothetical protein